MSSQVLNHRQAHWLIFLSDFDFQLTWGLGTLNIVDAPSRCVDFSSKKGDDTLLYQNQTMLSAQHTRLLFDLHKEAVSAIAITMLSIDNSTILDCFKAALHVDDEWRLVLAQGNTNFFVESDLVFHKGHLFVPRPLHSEILHFCHDQPAAGHPGHNHTLGLVSCDYSWPSINTFIHKYVKACNTCACTKAPHHKPFSLLKPLDISSQPWRAITMDFIVKLPLSHKFDSIWVVCDWLTCIAHLIPCHETIDALELTYVRVCCFLGV